MMLTDSAATLDQFAVTLVGLDVRVAMLRDAIIQHRAAVGDEAGAADFALWSVLDDDLTRRDLWQRDRGT